jgi:hypothetical protein
VSVLLLLLLLLLCLYRCCTAACRYNFMPLARGTAAVGYTTMLGLFWAAGMPISSVIPKDYQVGHLCWVDCGSVEY